MAEVTHVYMYHRQTAQKVTIPDDVSVRCPASDVELMALIDESDFS